MKRAEVLPLHNKHFFKTLYDVMGRRETNMVIDGSHTLWHEDDIKGILANDYNLISIEEK